MDANKNIYKKSIGKTHTNQEGMGMKKEEVDSFTSKQVGATFFRGSKPINGIWATANLEVSGVSIIPASYGVGDH